MAAEQKKPQMIEQRKPQVVRELAGASLIRVLGKDIRGDKKLFVGLTQIKGISWAFANAACKITGFDKDRKIQDLSKQEIEKVENFIKNPAVPSFLKNRRKDFDDGEDKHIYGEDIKLRREFDIKRLKKIHSYRGIRHTAGLPTRGQRTKSHFRVNRKKSGASASKAKKE